MARLIGKSYAKALVGAGDPPERVAAVLNDFKVAIIVYRERGRSYSFKAASLDLLFNRHADGAGFS